MTFAEWLNERGGTGVFVKTKASAVEDWEGGGTVFMAAGEVAPFNKATITRLVADGKATREGSRITLKGGAA